MTSLPRDIDPHRFDALHDDPEAWRGIVGSIGQALGARVVEPIAEGTVLVAQLDRDRILKLYPPFLRDHFEFECGMLGLLDGRLSVPTPRLLVTGEREGWPFVVMNRLDGQPLDVAWPQLEEGTRRSLLHRIGALTAEVHALAPAQLPPAAQAAVPPWPAFIARQRQRCADRQRRTGLPPQLLERLDKFIAGPLPEGPEVLLTGEYTPFNLFVAGGELAAMFDFGDGLIGPRGYDWLGPLCFLCAGNGGRIAAFTAGCGAKLDADLRLSLLRLLLLHRYSNLRAQIACPGWESAPTFEVLAKAIWPLPSEAFT